MVARRTTQLAGVAVEETAGQGRTSSGRSRSGGSGDGHDVDPEDTDRRGNGSPRLRPQVAVGRGDHPHVHANRLGAAQPRDLVLLQDAQQLDLRGRRQIADLVQEQRPAVGQLEAARCGAGPRR